MKNKIKFLGVITLILLVCCGKDDDKEVPVEVSYKNEVEVNSKQFELTNFKIEGVSTSEETFQYNIEELPNQTVLFNSDETANISFLTPNIPGGVYHIILENYETRLTLIVEKVVLTKKPVEIISAFETDLRSSWVSIEGNTSEDQELTAMLTSIDNYFENGSEEEKIEIAVYYRANKELINQLLNFEPNKSGRAGKLNVVRGEIGICSDDYIDLCRFSKNIIGMGTSVWLTYGLLATPPFELGALITGPAVAIFAKRARRSWNDFRDKEISIVDDGIDLLLGKSSRSNGNTKLNTTSIEFLNGKAKDVELKLNVRPVQESDIDNGLELLSTVNDGYNTVNTLIGKINTVFSWGNENISFFDKELIDPLSYSVNTTTIQRSITENEFSKFDFVVEHEQITLEKSYNSNGSVSLKLTANESFDFGTSIEINVFVSYEDEINEIVESFPVTVIAAAAAESIELVSGDNQTATVETALPNPIEIIVKDQNGDAFPGSIVNFTVTEGVVSSATAITDGSGKAIVSWTLGSSEGAQVLKVTVFKADGITALTGSPILVSAIGIVEPSLVGVWNAIGYDGKEMGAITNDGFVEECQVYLYNYAINSSKLIISDEILTLNINQTTSNVSYSSSENNKIDCESIKIKPEISNDSSSFDLSDFVKIESTNTYEKIERFNDGQTNTIIIQLVSENQIRFTNKHKDIDNITRTAFSILYNKE